MAIPRRGDLADAELSLGALELDPASGGVALTGTSGLDLSDVQEVCTFVQLRDSGGNVTIVGTDGSATSLTEHGTLRVFDNASPTATCQADVLVGTDSDGGGDCAVTVAVTAEATDAAGGFTLTNDLQTGLSTRSFGTAVGGPEMARQSAAGSFDAGTVTPITFTARDNAGAEDSCSVQVEVVDDTAPQLGCDLIPIDADPGQGGNPGQGGGNGNPQSNMFVVDFETADNCSAGGDINLVAEIDGVPVTDNEQVQITLTNPGGTVSASTTGGRLHIQTPLDGELTVTATDEAGNQTVCQTPSLRP